MGDASLPENGALPNGRPLPLTLLRLLIFVAVLGAFLGLSIRGLTKAQEDIGRSQCAHDLAQLSAALRAYSDSHRCFPSASDAASPESVLPPERVFPPELVDFVPYEGNPVFAGTAEDTWDRKIRERGYILREGDRWHLWYTGYNPARSDMKLLGYATSPDGFQWTRHPENPIFDKSWVEDMQVVKHGDTYYMVAEGRHDIAHMMTSKDRVHWQDHGSLDVRYANGKPLSAGPYGTPTLWIEGPTWYLFYERRDRAIWLAKSTDRKVWTNVQDDPVIPTGPDAYDRHAVALNQVVKHEGRYYAYYHANADPKWRGPWTTNVAESDDLVHWKKYPKNPIIPTDHSSAILVHDGRRHRLYTMHPDVRVYFPRASEKR